MTFGRGQNTDNTSPAEWVDESLDEVRPPLGKFQQEVAPLFGECENISPEQTSQQVVVGGRFGSRQHLYGNISFGKHLLQLDRPPAN